MTFFLVDIEGGDRYNQPNVHIERKVIYKLKDTVIYYHLHIHCTKSNADMEKICFLSKILK